MGCYPCVTWMAEFPYSLEADDKNHVGVASLDCYGESYLCNDPHWRPGLT